MRAAHPSPPAVVALFMAISIGSAPPLSAVVRAKVAIQFCALGEDLHLGHANGCHAAVHDGDIQMVDSTSVFAGQQFATDQRARR